MCNLIPEELQDTIATSITVSSLKNTKSDVKGILQEVLASGKAQGVFSWNYEEEVQDLNTMLKSIDLLLGWYE